MAKPSPSTAPSTATTPTTAIQDRVLTRAIILIKLSLVNKYKNNKGITMAKKKMVKKTKKKSSIKDEFNKLLSKKLKQRFSGIKTKDLGDGMMEISIN